MYPQMRLNIVCSVVIRKHAHAIYRYTQIGFSAVKIERKKNDISDFAQNIYCGPSA